MKASTQRTLRQQGIDPDTQLGRIVADMVEQQEVFVRERDRRTSQSSAPDDAPDGRDAP